MRGLILFNGNVADESDFVRTAAELLLSSRHQDEAVRASRKVLLVTAAWRDNEYQEGHVKRALSAIGLTSRYQDGYDANLQNLSAWHTYQEFFHTEPHLADQWQSREALIEQTRHLYLEKNAFYIALLRRSLQQMRQNYPDLRLSHILTDEAGEFSHPPTDFDGNALLGHFLAHDARETIERLMENDDRMVELLSVLDDHFATATGLRYNPTWLRLRERLEESILSANSIFILGGSLGALHGCLNFFRLRETFMEAWRRGTSFFTTSAGSLLLCERIIVYNDFPSELGPRREFQLFGRGFGLVRPLQLFPHCMDRIQTDDTDNLSYLAYRFHNRSCVGLNEKSFLLMEVEPELRCTSLGSEDGVYVFDPSGKKVRYNLGEQINVYVRG